MFLTTRIVNGLLSALALLVVGVFFFSTAMRTGTIVCGLVVVFYIIDLIFRKKSTKADLVFAALWTLAFLLGTFYGLQTISAGMPPEEIFDHFLVYATFIGMYAAPFLLNGIYLLRLYLQKRSAAQTT
jgi:hypothetical protein